ncbi:hypothetical protein M9H77_30199 [Catharanthus roseus]|uniref:Uncharacterized protein n=1 Tax=Catharanthus roseus TaxID=4058 RepID=A0ACB9ZZ66_CATRO|nr:hypothetical protein M9H77_30199 [Catharanthus roseus]
MKSDSHFVYVQRIWTQSRFIERRHRAHKIFYTCDPVDHVVSFDGKQKAELVKAIHAKVQDAIETKNKKLVATRNVRKKLVVFEPGDRMERFPSQRKTKLDARGNGPYQVLERLNDNAYRIDLLGDYNVSATFNISDLSPFDVGEDLRMNLFKSSVDDVNWMSQSPIEVKLRPITRAQ